MIKKIRAWMHRNNKDYCKMCGKRMNEVEKYYYGIHCEKCEGKWYRKMQKKA